MLPGPFKLEYLNLFFTRVFAENVAVSHPGADAAERQNLLQVLLFCHSVTRNGRAALTPSLNIFF